MLKRLKEWYGNLPGIVRGLITAAGVLLMAPVLVTMMKLLLFPRETPATLLDLLGEQSRTGFTFDLDSLNKQFEGFSVYDGLKNAEYDLSFLDDLN